MASVDESAHHRIQAILVTQLRKFHELCPKHFSTPIDVLLSVGETVEDQLKQLFQREIQDRREERIVLIPYHLENAHWIGLLIRFQPHSQVTQVECIDPLHNSNTLPDQVQNQITQICSNVVIQSRELLKHDDPQCSALLTVKNLLAAAGNIPILKHPNDGNEDQFSELVEHCHDETEEEMKIFWNELSHLDLDGFSPPNDCRISELEEIFNFGLRKFHFENATELPDEMAETRKRIKKLEQQKRMQVVEAEMKFLYELQTLNELAKLTTALRSVPSRATPAIHPFEASKKQEYLKFLKQDLVRMPMGTERTLIELLLQLEDETSSNVDSVRVALSTLKDQLKTEELLSETNRTIVQNLDIDARSNDRHSMIRNLHELRKQIRTLNVAEIFRLVEKSREAAQLIRDKEIVLLVGETGAGKSTTIQFLAGLSMEAVQMEIVPGKFIEHITAVGPIKNPQLTEVISSPLSKSETRFIIPVTISLKDVFGVHETGAMILCDTPGFNDTAGAEVDIANSVGLSEALRGTKSVKILALSGYQDLGSRAQGIERLANILIRMINGIEDKLDSIVYAFTRYPEEMDVNALIESLNKYRLQSDSTGLLTTVLNDLIKKTEEIVYKIDPIHGDRKILLKKLRKIRGISYPSEVFRLPLSETTQACVVDQVQKNKSRIIRAIVHQDIELVLYYLNDLKIMNDLISENVVRMSYEESIRFINETVDEHCTKVMSKFNNLLISQTGLNPKDILDYKTLVDYLVRIQILKEYRTSSSFTPEVLIQNIITQLEERYRTVENEELYSVLVRVYVGNVSLLKESFEELQNYHNNMSKEFQRRFEELVQSAKELILSNDFERVSAILLKLTRSLYNLRSHLGEQMEMKYRQIVQFLLHHLENFSKETEIYFAKIRLNETDLEILKKRIEILRSAQENSLLQKCLATDGEETSKDLTKIYNEFLAKVIKYFDHLTAKIAETLSTNNTDALEDTEKWIQIINTLHEMPDLKKKTAKNYSETAEHIRAYLRLVQNNVEQSILSLQQQTQTVNYKLLARSVSRLQNAQWINIVLPGTYDVIMHRLTDEFVEYAKQLETAVKRLDLGYKCSENIPIAVEIMNRMQSISGVEQSIPELEKYRMQISEYFQQCVRKVFDWIPTIFSGTAKSDEIIEEQKMVAFDAPTANYVLIYLNECENINYNHIRESALQLRENLHRYLNEYGRFLDEQIRKSFERICCVGEDLTRYSQQLETYLNELSSLSKFTHVFECFEGKEKVDYWLREFLRYYHTITNNLEDYKSLHRTRELRDQLTVVQALGIIDRFCAKIFNDRGFGDLYRQYQLEMTRTMKEVCNTVRECFAKEDYAKADLVLHDIDQDQLSSKDLQQIKHDLENSLDQLMKKTKSSIIWLSNKPEKEKDNQDQIKQVKENIDQIRLVLTKGNILNLLHDQMRVNLRNFDDEMNEMLGDILLKRLHAIEVYINTDYFLEADRGLENFSRIQRDLTGYCTSLGITEKSEELRERLNQTLNQIIKREELIDIDKYPTNPPKTLLEELEKLSKHGNVRYNQVYSSSLTVIKEQFNIALEKARVAPLEERQAKIRSMNRASHFLPDVLQLYFKLPIEELNKLMAKEGEDANTDDTNIIRIEALAQQYTAQKLPERLKELREETMKKLREYQTNAQTYLDQHQTQSATGIMRKIGKYRAAVGGYFPEIEEIYRYVHSRITNDISYCYETLVNRSSLELTQPVENAINRLIIYLKFPDIMDQKMREGLRTKLQTYFNHLALNSKRFQAALEQMNLFEVHQTMTLSKQWNEIVIRMMPIFPDEMSGIISHTQMTLEFEKSIQHLVYELDRGFFVDDQLPSEEELDRNSMKIINIIRGGLPEYKDILPSTLDIKNLEVKLKGKIEKYGNDLVRSASTTDLSTRDIDYFRLCYSYLLRFEGRSIQDILNTFRENIFERIAMVCEQVEDETEFLDKLRYFGERLVILNYPTKFPIDKILQKYKKYLDRGRTKQLMMILNRLDIARNITHALNIDDWQNRWRQMEHQHRLDYVLDNLHGDQIDKSTLAKCYKQFEQIYHSLTYQFSGVLGGMNNIQSTISGLSDHIKNMASALIKTFTGGTWDYRLVDSLIQLIAHVFALWTLANTHHSTGTHSYLLIPHVAQVIAVFRLLGLDSPIHMPMAKVNFLSNHLIEIGTGEGKSIVLAITACIFALAGFDVTCSYYSKALSTRDWDAFSSIFRALDLTERLTYSSFDQMCERLVGEQCDAREKVRDMFVNNKTVLNVDQVKLGTRRKVLLIDEVDMFLNDRFYGKLHASSVIVKSGSIKMLFDAIWQKKTFRSLGEVKALSVYQTCAIDYSHWTSLLDKAVEEMLRALEAFSSSPYLVQSDKIVYVQGESIVDNVLHGYRTMWTYYHENEKGSISQSSLESNIGLIINCGNFSYAELFQDFSYIGGVTSTLKTLIQVEKDILRKVYALNKNTYIPSMFGKSNRSFNSAKDVYVVEGSDYFKTIGAEIDMIRQTDRAILIFFESEEKLMTFYHSEILSSMKQEVLILTERVAVEQRAHCIERATTTGKVTLLTPAFSRGVDSLCRTSKVLVNGGIHIVQTFFSKIPSEEQQIMSTGVCQGKPGSYRMILLNKDLERILGSTRKKELTQISGKKLYETLNKARNRYSELKCVLKHRKIEECRVEHRHSIDFLFALCIGEVETVKRFLSKQTSVPIDVQFSS